MSKTILITGATGNVSAGVIEHLKKSDHRLIGLVRNPDKARHLADVGVELRQGDMEKPWTLACAFQGVDAVWLLTAPGPRAPEQSSNAVWAARNAGVGHIVRMSAIGASHTAPTINGRLHGLSDAELMASGVPYTIVRPHFFIVLRERPRHLCRGGIARHAKRAPSSHILRLGGYLYTDQV